MAIDSNSLLTIIQSIANQRHLPRKLLSQRAYSGIKFYLKKERIILIHKRVSPYVKEAFISLHHKEKMGT
jgi:hypothetical protein